ncbi:MAG: integrase core domain-containing protein [Collinsella stercoris]|uniref:integrase core domain-containing protein n=1 Tax=Collinsella stercoris TaxID=147206 RepID=UPI003992CCD7
MAASAGRHPISAQRRIPGAPRSACYHVPASPPAPPAPDPMGPDAPGALGIGRPVSRPGNPRDNAVVESTSRILERELAAGGRFGSEEEPRAALFDWANQCNDFRIHSTLSYMGPVEFRGAGLILS